MRLIARAALQIQKPVSIVFQSIVNPDVMTRYFISESDGRLETGKDRTWAFSDFPGNIPIRDVQVIPGRSVRFVWDPETVVHITLEPMPGDSTLVRVSEDGKVVNEENLKWVIQNTEGWANFLACMKAWLEYQVPLRKGAFDFLKASMEKED